MPQFPRFASRLNALTGSVYEQYRDRMKKQGDRLIKLHIGDTYLPPDYPLPLESRFVQQFPGFNKYCSTFGVEPLRSALFDRLLIQNRLPLEKNDLMITNGASNALSISTLALLDPGDEVVVLTPCWPFFTGMVRLAGAIPVEVPFYVPLFEDPDLDVASYVEQHITDKTVALYVNSPNNPSGKMLDRQQLEQLGSLAKKNQLWLISDEAYDGLTFDGREHISLAALGDWFEQTVSIFTFSKIFMFAGIRLGYVAAREEVIRQLNKIMVHEIYSPSAAGQYLMVEPARSTAEWMPRVRAHYEEMRDLICGKLRVKFHRPEGAYFLFFPVTDYLGVRDYWEVFSSCIDRGISLASGREFGADYEQYVRLCFTGEPPEKIEVAADRINNIFGV